MKEEISSSLVQGKGSQKGGKLIRLRLNNFLRVSQFWQFREKKQGG
jgi:hypothetical protein